VSEGGAVTDTALLTSSALLPLEAAYESGGLFVRRGHKNTMQKESNDGHVQA
jgi:hypothetical protein